MASATRPRWRWMPWPAVAASLLGPAAHAGSSTEFWPEASVYVHLNDRTRLYLDASLSDSKESNTGTFDASACVDVSIEPVVRAELRTLDWQRRRFLWARVGYARVFKVADRTREVSEDRGIVALYARAPLPAEAWLEARARTDLRWIGGAYSTRYRFRLEASRELEWLGRPLTPYANAESFYDTRYDGWARGLLQAGAELETSKTFRWEAYLARQVDRLPGSGAVNALGVVAKWYL